MSDFWLYQGDCVEVLRSWPEASVDAVVCDPPAGISFMGKEWDADKGGRREWISWLASAMAEARRVLKPGGHALVWAMPRTSHWTATALEDAGFELRDCLTHIFGSGFPKSKNVALSIDKGEGHPNRGRAIPTASTHLPTGKYAEEKLTSNPVEAYTAKTEAAKAWEGWGTGLKPASEHWWLARKPLEGTVAANVQKWGTGALNIDGCRIATTDAPSGTGGKRNGKLPGDERTDTGAGLYAPTEGAGYEAHTAGRWPANVLFMHDAVCLPEACVPGCPVMQVDQYGGVSRFFYVAKASRRERDHGLEGFPVHSGGEATDRDDGTAGLNSPRAGAGRTGGARNIHPTLKPVALMRYLCRLVTPPGGIVLDPFMGSGTTGMAARLEGFRFVGIEKEAEYLAIAHARIAAALTLK